MYLERGQTTKWHERCRLQMGLQDQTQSQWRDQEVQGLTCSQGLLADPGHQLQ